MDVGNKASGLVRLDRLVPGHVPPFEVIPFREAIVDYQVVTAQIVSGAQAYIWGKRVSNKIEATIAVNDKALRAFHAGIVKHGWSRVSLRTSALSEDTVDASFAGQYVTQVDVVYDYDALKQAVIDCFTSMYTPGVLSYAKERRVNDFQIGGALIVQQMFYGDKTGVMFTENGNGEVVLALSGSWKNTTVEGDNAVQRVIPKTNLETKRHRSSLHELAKIGSTLERKVGYPLDIEWAICGKEIALLQMRPLTQPTTTYRLEWDGTNISENYPGVTLPLTYSFIRQLYARVYPSFFRMLGTSRRTLDANADVFQNTLGYIDGHVYYRIENWYELVRLIPGRRNQEFFEAMLNPVKTKGKVERRNLVSYLHPSVVWLSLRMLWLLTTSRYRSQHFSRTFTRKMDEYALLAWRDMSAEAILRHIHRVRDELLTLWSVPILNDINVMISHGILKNIVLKNCGNDIYVKVLSGLTDKASIKPLHALRQLGQYIDGEMKLVKAKSIEMLRQTASWSQVEQKANDFITQYGGRTPDELQLENPRIGEDVMNVVQLAYASRGAHAIPLENTADAFVLPLSWPRQIVARWVIARTRQAIDYRERFRFNRAQVFGLAREAFLAIGERLTAADIIVERDDVFWLTEQEINDTISGHAWDYDAKRLITMRKKQHSTRSRLPYTLRLIGEGDVAARNLRTVQPQKNGGTLLAGKGVAAGEVTAEVIVVDTFDPSIDVQGKILIARHIDPGWTLLLVQAAGVITERGNALSHVAIVSRELGIPAVVGAVGVTDIVRSGTVLTIDGTTGEIQSEHA